MKEIKEIVEKNLKEGEYFISVRVKPEDSVALIRISDNIEETIERIYKRIHEKYRDHVIGYKESYYHDGVFSHWELVLDAEYQKMFDAETAAYYNDKASWIARFGSN